VVIGAYATEPESIHVHPAIASLSDLRGKRIRANNAFEAAVIEKLGMRPTLLPINEAAEGISSGVIDGATRPVAPMPELGIGRVATNHYMLRTSPIPLLLLMNRSKFASLPDNAKAMLRKYSGDCAVEHFIEVMEQLKSDPKRQVIAPSATDLKKAQITFDAVVGDFAAKQAGETLLRRRQGQNRGAARVRVRQKDWRFKTRVAHVASANHPDHHPGNVCRDCRHLDRRQANNRPAAAKPTLNAPNSGRRPRNRSSNPWI
jgi:TRAP-type mannitol/chloroaromatic compound transport system substrate-binding protein